MCEGGEGGERGGEGYHMDPNEGQEELEEVTKELSKREES